MRLLVKLTDALVGLGLFLAIWCIGLVITGLLAHITVKLLMVGWHTFK